MRAGKATIWRILHAGEIKPHKVHYYLERRDAQFEEKMREVLMGLPRGGPAKCRLHPTRTLAR